MFLFFNGLLPTSIDTRPADAERLGDISRARRPSVEKGWRRVHRREWWRGRRADESGLRSAADRWPVWIFHKRSGKDGNPRTPTRSSGRRGPCLMARIRRGLRPIRAWHNTRRKLRKEFRHILLLLDRDDSML
jgi:hypothetical protein